MTKQIISNNRQTIINNLPWFTDESPLSTQQPLPSHSLCASPFAQQSPTSSCVPSGEPLPSFLCPASLHVAHCSWLGNPPLLSGRLPLPSIVLATPLLQYPSPCVRHPCFKSPLRTCHSAIRALPARFFHALSTRLGMGPPRHLTARLAPASSAHVYLF